MRQEGGQALNMSLRDYLAGQAMTGICSSNEQLLVFQRLAAKGEGSPASLIAIEAYKLADAMLLERDKGGS